MFHDVYSSGFYSVGYYFFNLFDCENYWCYKISLFTFYGWIAR